jgi:hypothetical protein
VYCPGNAAGTVRAIRAVFAFLSVGRKHIRHCIARSATGDMALSCRPLHVGVVNEGQFRLKLPCWEGTSCANHIGHTTRWLVRNCRTAVEVTDHKTLLRLVWSERVKSLRVGEGGIPTVGGLGVGLSGSR